MILNCEPDKHDLELVQVEPRELTYRCRVCNETITQWEDHHGA